MVDAAMYRFDLLGYSTVFHLICVQPDVFVKKICSGARTVAMIFVRVLALPRVL